MPDVLPDFFTHWLGFKLPAGLGGFQLRLFPHAMLIPGWKHLWDNVIQRGLCSLTWFPLWLKWFKSLNSFLRNYSYIEQICVDLRAKGIPWVSPHFKNSLVPCSSLRIFVVSGQWAPSCSSLQVLVMSGQWTQSCSSLHSYLM